MREYVSIAVRNNIHFVLYHFCFKGRCGINIHLKYLEKSGFDGGTSAAAQPPFRLDNPALLWEPSLVTPVLV